MISNKSSLCLWILQLSTYLFFQKMLYSMSNVGLNSVYNIAFFFKVTQNAN